MAGESIHTENSYKYNVSDLCDLAEAGGFEPERVWTDESQFFSVLYLSVGQVENGETGLLERTS
jgi:uncharacterized SAM-dependent methyltransferase